MNRWMQNEAGFTLVEILLTISIVGILAISILQLFSIGNQWQKKNFETASAMLGAQATLEQIKSDKKFNGFAYINERHYNQRKLSRNGVQQTVQIDSLDVNLKKIIIIVKWSGGSDSLISMIGKY